MNSNLRALLKKQQYGLFGNHSACKICHWTKASLRNEAVCYKQQFYGIQSHRCLQMTPMVDACTHNCVFCWRATDFSNTSIKDPDEPGELIDGLIAQQKKLLIGFKGFEGTDQKKLEEALKPNMAAISLSGEPTLYPKLSQLLSEFHKRGFTTFMVTNGTKSKALASLDTLPTQLYISLVSPNEQLYPSICRPLKKDGWKSIQESLEIMRGLNTRRVVRMTTMKKTMIDTESYAKSILKAEPDFIEVKAYMHVGFSRNRLPGEEMPTHEEILRFSKELAKVTGYTLADQKEDSRVALLKK